MMARIPCLSALMFCCLGQLLRAEQTISVSERGARGDAVAITADVISGSPVISVSAPGGFRQGDVGKIIMLHEAGPETPGAGRQDYLGKISSVHNASSVLLDPPPARTAKGIRGLVGTDNSKAFQKCVDSARGASTVITVPAGNYLLVPPRLLDPEYRMDGPCETSPAVVIRKSGIRFLGHDRSDTVLTACGAWQLKGVYATRGQLFECLGPVSGSGTLIFENLTMDGGVRRGRQSKRSFPASVTDGSGWDVTHDAVMDAGGVPLHRYKAFRHCAFLHWRGEILKSVSGWDQGFIEVTDCVFRDGNASAFNFSFSHLINRCAFSCLDMAMEFYEGRMASPSFFLNSTISDVRGGLVIVGALTNHPSPPYTIQGNTIASSGSFGVLLGPAENLLISSNRFQGLSFAVGTGPGSQGTTLNQNISIEGNTLSNVGTLLLVQASGNDGMRDVTVSGNLMTGGAFLGQGWGSFTNVTFSGNTATNGAGGFDGSRLLGQWFRDKLSNRYPPRRVPGTPGGTNLVSYAMGARQAPLATSSGVVFVLDDSHPEKIPIRAKMILSPAGENPAELRLSMSGTRGGIPLLPGKDVTLEWSNCAWVLIDGSPVPKGRNAR